MQLSYAMLRAQIIAKHSVVKIEAPSSDVVLIASVGTNVYYNTPDP